MSFKNKFSAMQSSVHFPNKQLLNSNNYGFLMTCFPTHYSVYQLKIFLEGLWFLRQTITKQNGPQPTYKTIASGTFHFPIRYILVEPITYQLS